MAAEPEPLTSPQGGRTASPRTFLQVALVFCALLAVGLVFALVVYRKYVAYEPSVARHVPPDAGIALRIDLTHVMFYEPFRRSIMPLAEHGGPVEPPRHQRLAEHGVRLGADVRELLLALGPGRGDWALVVGGQLPKTGLSESLADVLRAEGQTIDVQAGGIHNLRSSGLAFAQAADGAFVLGSGEARVRAALPVRAVDTALTEGSGGARVLGSRLGPGWQDLRVSLRAGSVVAADIHADFTDPRGGREALTGLLRQAASLDATLVHPVESAVRTPTATGESLRVHLPKESVEALSRWLAARAVETFVASPGAS
jgi:hypothetical protein